MANSIDKDVEPKYRVNVQGMIVEELDDSSTNASQGALNSNYSGQPWIYEQKAENYK
jgi:hypothetical protein